MKQLIKHLTPKPVRQLIRRTWKSLEVDMPLCEQNNLLPSFSAWGEDRIIKAWLDIKGIDGKAVRYLDIGAAYPVFLSNTYLLYRNGASGVLVEPDPSQVLQLKSVRPRDEVLPVGVAGTCGTGKLLQMTSPVFNTFSTEAAQKAVSQSRGWNEDQRQDVVGEIEVKLVTIGSILQEHFADRPLHVLSIDVEGLDFAVIQGIDFERFQPVIICTEIGAERAVYEGILSPFGYEFVAWTPDNYIFVKMS